MEWLKLKYDKNEIKYNESEAEGNHLIKLICKVETTSSWGDKKTRTAV